MPKYKMSIEIETDQERSELVEALHFFGEDLVSNCHPEKVRIISQSVEEIGVIDRGCDGGTIR